MQLPRFEDLAASPDATLDLLALALAAAFRAIDAARALATLDGPGEEVTGVLRAAGTREAEALALSAVLGTLRGFRGDAEQYDRPENSMLDRVLERRRGLPILLSASRDRAPRTPDHPVRAMCPGEDAPIVALPGGMGDAMCSPNRGGFSMRQSVKRGVIAAAVCGVLFVAPSVAGAADAINGLTDDNQLVRFNSDSPGEAHQIVAVRGLQQGETLLGLDTRPQNDTLYAVGTSNRIYQVNPVTGATRPVFGPLSSALNGASFGTDFNPVADALRIVSDAEQNLRVPFVGGDAGTAQAEGALQYAAGDPGAGSNPSVGAAAYTNSTPGASQTTLFDIDTARDVLVRQDPPGAGTLVTIGALGFDAQEPAAFDISPQDNVAYAALRRQGQDATSLYRIDLTTGHASAVQPLARIATPKPLRGIAVATGAVPDDRVAPQLSVAFSSTILEHNTNVLKPSVSCNEACAIAVTARVAGRRAGRGFGALGAAGRNTVDVPLRAAARLRIARKGTELISLNIVAIDAAGNRRERNRISRTQTLAERRAG